MDMRDRKNRYEYFRELRKNESINALLTSKTDEILDKIYPIVELDDKKMADEATFWFETIVKLDWRLGVWIKNFLTDGDLFLELVRDTENPREGILKLQSLPPECVYILPNGYGMSAATNPDFYGHCALDSVFFDTEDIVHVATEFPYGRSILSDLDDVDIYVTAIREGFKEALARHLKWKLQ